MVYYAGLGALAVVIIVPLIMLVCGAGAFLAGSVVILLGLTLVRTLAGTDARRCIPSYMLVVYQQVVESRRFLDPDARREIDSLVVETSTLLVGVVVGLSGVAATCVVGVLCWLCLVFHL